MALCLRKSQPLSGWLLHSIMVRRGMMRRPLRPKASKTLTLGWKIGATVSRCSVATCQVSRNVSITSFQFMSLASVCGLVVAVVVEACRTPSRAPARPAAGRRRGRHRAWPAPRSGRGVSATGIGTRLRSAQVRPGKPSAWQLHQAAVETVGEGMVGAHEQAFARASSRWPTLAPRCRQTLRKALSRPSLPRTTRIGTPLRSSAR